MHEGYAHRARRPPAFPDAPEATDWDSIMVTLCLEAEYEGCLVRKYAVVQPMIPPPKVPPNSEKTVRKLVREEVRTYDNNLPLWCLGRHCAQHAAGQ
jgi:hypothetical protein